MLCFFKDSFSENTIEIVMAVFGINDRKLKKTAFWKERNVCLFFVCVTASFSHGREETNGLQSAQGDPG